MNLEGGFLLFLGLMFLVPLLFWLPRLVNWIAGRKLIPLWMPFILVPVLLAGGSLYLDNTGVIAPVKLVDKKEDINHKRNGSWNRTLSLHIEYQAPGEIVPTLITLGCDAATFDKLRVGETVEARVLNIGQQIKFARLKDRSTFSLITKFIPHSPLGPWRQATAVVHDIRHVTRWRDVSCRKFNAGRTPISGPGLSCRVSGNKWPH